MKGHLLFERIYIWAITLVIFFQTVFPKLVPITIILLFITIIFGVKKSYLEFKINLLNILFVGFYLAYFIGFFFTKDSALAKSYLENKLSFIIFPILFSFIPNFKLSLRIPTIGLITSIVLITFWGFFKVYSCGFNNSFTNCLPYFSDIHHPTYFAVYILISIALTIYGFQQNWKGFSTKWVILYTIFGIVISFLTFSLSAVLFLVIISGCFIWMQVKNKLGFKKTILLSSFLIIGLITFILTTGFKEDFKYTFSSVKSYVNSPEDFLKNGNRYLIGNEVRLMLWTATGMVISEHPLGVGTGSTDFYLSEKLQKYGLYDLASYKYNPHNQFLQTFLEIGVFGFIILLLIVYFSITKAIKHKNWLLLIVVGSLIFNSLFESMLQRQSGIVFYTFWMCLLYIYIENKQRLINK